MADDLGGVYSAVEALCGLKGNVEKLEEELAAARAELETASEMFVEQWPHQKKPIIYEQYTFAVRQRTRRLPLTLEVFESHFGADAGVQHWDKFTQPVQKEVRPPATLTHLCSVVGKEEAGSLWKSPELATTTAYLAIVDADADAVARKRRRGGAGAGPAGGAGSVEGGGAT